MAEQANIASIDALEGFRVALLRYVEQARTALEDAEGEVRRTRAWLDQDRSRHWVVEMKRRTKQLEQAEAELYNATITRPRESHGYFKMAVARARQQVVDAEEKLRLVKRWRHEFDNQATPLLRQLGPMFHLVGRELPKGVHALGEMIKVLQEYAERVPAVKRMPDINQGTAGEGDLS